MMDDMIYIYRGANENSQRIPVTSNNIKVFELANTCWETCYRGANMDFRYGNRFRLHRHTLHGRC